MKLCAIQTHPHRADSSNNQEKILSLLSQAHEKDAKILVFPELATSGYVFETPEKLEKCAINIGHSAFLEAVKSRSREFRSVIVLGLPEKDGTRIFNSAVIITAGAIVGTYRKVNLWDHEKELFSPGDGKFPVFDTQYGKMGVLICYDLWKIDVGRTYGHINYMTVPTNWLTIPGEGKQNKENPIGLYLAQRNAALQGCTYICADRVGREGAAEFIGRSGIIDRNGTMIAGPAGSETEEIIYADVTEP